MRLKRTNNRNWLMILIVALILIYVLVIISPFYWSIITSLKTRNDFRRNFNFGFPKMGIAISNYYEALKALRVQINLPAGGSRYVYFPELFLNSVIYAFGCMFVQNLVACIVAYLCSKYGQRKFSKLIYSIVIVTMILPIAGSLASEINMAKTFGLYDSFFGIFVMRANFLGMNFLIYYAAFKVIPWDFAEAAFIDGASDLKVMTRIMFPLIRPTFLIACLLSFIGYWNDYYIPMIYLPSKPTIAYALYCLQIDSGSAVSSVPAKMAGSIIVFLPVFIIFLIFNKKLIGNLTVGGLKG